MRRMLVAATIGAVVLLGTAGTASADVGDITRLSIASSLQGTVSEAEVNGQIRCQATIDYGLIVKVTQSPPDPDIIDGNDNADSTTEAVGAFGPNVGNQGNTPCSQSLQPYDVVVQQNRDSGDFNEDSVWVFVVGGSSAENGERGPGPFIGDLEIAGTLVDFDLNR